MLKLLRNIAYTALVLSVSFGANQSFSSNMDDGGAHARLREKGQTARAALRRELFESRHLNIEATRQSIQSTDHLRLGGISGRDTSILVLDVAFSLHKDIIYDVNALTLAELSTSNDLAHGTTVSCTAAGRSRYMNYEPIACGASIFPFVSTNRRLTIDAERTRSTINQYVMDQIERTLMSCEQQRKPIPRVLNMSLAMTFAEATLQSDVNRLVELLDKYDLLIVKAIGNLGNVMNGDFCVAPYGNHFTLEKGYVDIASALTRYPRLLRRTILVGVAEFRNGWWNIEGSNKAGVLADHTVFAETGVRINGSQHFGTSHSTPKLTSFFTAMNKYFPELSMVQLKVAVLATAADNQLNNHGLQAGAIKTFWGRGVFNPGRAWIKCVQDMGLLDCIPQHHHAAGNAQNPHQEKPEPAPRHGRPDYQRGGRMPVVHFATVLPKLQPHLTSVEIELVPNNFNAALCAEVYRDWVERIEAGQTRPNYQAFQMTREEAATFYFFHWIMKRPGCLNFHFQTSPSVAPADFDWKKYMANYPELLKEAEGYLLSPEMYARLHYVNEGYQKQYTY